MKRLEWTAEQRSVFERCLSEMEKLEESFRQPVWVAVWDAVRQRPAPKKTSRATRGGRLTPARLAALHVIQTYSITQDTTRPPFTRVMGQPSSAMMQALVRDGLAKWEPHGGASRYQLKLTDAGKSLVNDYAP